MGNIVCAGSNCEENNQMESIAYAGNKYGESSQMESTFYEGNTQMGSTPDCYYFPQNRFPIQLFPDSST